MHVAHAATSRVDRVTFGESQQAMFVQATVHITSYAATMPNAVAKQCSVSAMQATLLSTIYRRTLSV